MKCSEISNQISAYIDGELTDSERQEFEEHIQGCEACRLELEELQAVALACRGLEMEEPPPDFHERLKDHLSSNKKTGLTRVAAMWSASRYKALAVAAVLVVVVASGTILPLAMAPMGSRVQDSGSPDFGLFMEPEIRAPMEPAAADDMWGYDMDMEEGGEKSVSGFTSPFEPGMMPVERKIIKSANLQMEVHEDNFGSAQQAVVGITQSSGGFVQESSRWEAPYGSNARFLLRIPESNFSGVLDEMRKLGKVTSENMSGRDVTEEYVDIDTRVASLRVHEQRLLEILSKAQNVDELLRIESELSRVRSEIERLTGRLNYLGSLVAMSTVEVHLVSVKDLTPEEPTLWDQVVAAFLRTLEAIADFATRTVIFLSGAAPVLLILAAIWYIIRRKR